MIWKVMKMMRIEDLTEKWNTVPSADSSFQRIDDSHILDIFVGKDSGFHREIMIISDIEPAKINSNKALDIQKGVRKDNRWATRIKLIKNEEEEVFTHLCWDLIEHSRKASTKTLALEILINRFLKWQKLMESGTALLSEEKIRGIIGELLYAKNYLYILMGWDAVFSAWLGPDGSDKDFVFDDTWAEVKTIKPGKTSVVISSLEQMESDKVGYLVVMVLDNTSASDIDGFSFAGLIDEIRSALQLCPSAAFEFESKLFELGYSYHREYYEKHYVLQNTRKFVVDDSFPKLLKSNMPKGIVKAQYDIALSEIISYETENV